MRVRVNFLLNQPEPEEDINARLLTMLPYFEHNLSHRIDGCYGNVVLDRLLIPVKGHDFDRGMAGLRNESTKAPN
jgi:hypothetical protein